MLEENASSGAKVGTDGKGVFWNRSRNPYANVKRGRREDLCNIFFRSAWEANYARILNHYKDLGLIIEWEYEPQKFYFTDFGYKSGPWVFTPDFGVYSSDETLEYHEIKGRETGSDRRKYSRFRKHSGYELKVVGKTEYRLLEARFSPTIPNWE